MKKEIVRVAELAKSGMPRICTARVGHHGMFESLDLTARFPIFYFVLSTRFQRLSTVSWLLNGAAAKRKNIAQERELGGRNRSNSIIYNRFKLIARSCRQVFECLLRTEKKNYKMFPKSRSLSSVCGEKRHRIVRELHKVGIRWRVRSKN